MAKMTHHYYRKKLTVSKRRLFAHFFIFSVLLHFLKSLIPPVDDVTSVMRHDR